MRTAFFTFFLLLTLAVCAQRAEVDQEKWGVAVKAGISLFDGDLTEKNSSFFPQQTSAKFAFGVTGEYYFIPQLGVIAEYMYLPTGSDLADLKFSGDIHSGTAYLSLNFLNLLEPRRNQRWNIYVNPGLGLSYYNSESTKSSYAEPGKISGQTAFHYIFDLGVEYSISNSVALLLNGQYRFYNKDNFEAMREKQGDSNDGIYITTLAVKYKFQNGKQSYRGYYYKY